MTLLEAVIAFVILSVVGIACLDQSRGAAQLQRASVEWTQAIALGERALAEEVGSAPPLTTDAATRGRDARVQVERRAWRSGVDQVAVSVSLANGATYTVTRLTPSLAGAR